MIQISKIKDKEIIEVVVQKNCTASGKSPVYQAGQDCLNDCSAVDKPNWWKCKEV